MDVAGDGRADADVVIEAIFENIEAKRAVCRARAAHEAGAILATNTSSIKIETLCENLADPTRLVGIHFFNPVAQMQLVEIVRGASTQSQVAQTLSSSPASSTSCRCPARARPGFVVNRI
jgi:3-hydroxyacyl-CoA dehydrogenase/enoyl-CoA hydratase/3-hydroxybutyryl-CoA epimerase